MYHFFQWFDLLMKLTEGSISFKRVSSDGLSVVQDWWLQPLFDEATCPFNEEVFCVYQRSFELVREGYLIPNATLVFIESVSSVNKSVFDEAVDPFYEVVFNGYWTSYE